MSSSSCWIKGPDSDDISSAAGFVQDYDYAVSMTWSRGSARSCCLGNIMTTPTRPGARDRACPGNLSGPEFFPSFESLPRTMYRATRSTVPRQCGPTAARLCPSSGSTRNREPLAPGTRGAEVDYGHPGVCASVMAYCSRDRNLIGPSALDFAILTDLGYEILDQASASEPELYGYGAWGRYGAWGVGVERRLSGSSDRLRAAADAFGMNPGDEPRRLDSLDGRSHVDRLSPGRRYRTRGSTAGVRRSSVRRGPGGPHGHCTL